MRKPDFSTSISEFFEEQIDAALENRRLQTSELTVSYLVQMLGHYAFTNNLFAESETNGKKRSDTLAELYLKAFASEPSVRVDLLKRLGDTSLYISGFFGDSLKRKIVDIDYYASMGGVAYGNLAEIIEEDAYAQVYQEFSERFMDFVDVLTYISQQAFVQTDADLLRLYDRYVSTGSKLAEEQLIQKGLLQVGQTTNKGQKQ
jgi:hypothetical protein